jgi:uncharacterized protein (TIRG00374 family)
MSVIVVLTIAFVWLFLHNSNLSDVWTIMRQTSLGWFAFGLFVNFSALLFRTFRWQVLIDDRKPPAFYPTFFANTVGYMLSTVLPIRAGDVVRPALLARRTKVRFSAALGTVVTERLLDLYGLLLPFVYFVLRHWNGFANNPRTARSFFIVKSGAIGAIALLVAATLLILGIYLFQPWVRRFHGWLARFVPSRFHNSWMHFYDAFVQSLILSPAAFGRVVLFTVGVWTCLNAQFWIVLVALHRALPFDASFFISGIATIGLAIPTPGGVGGFHKACQLVLTTFYHFDIDTSVAVAVMLHLVGTLPVLVTGLALFAHAGLSWREVKSVPVEEASGESE